MHHICNGTSKSHEAHHKHTNVKILFMYDYNDKQDDNVKHTHTYKIISTFDNKQYEIVKHMMMGISMMKCMIMAFRQWNKMSILEHMMMGLAMLKHIMNNILAANEMTNEMLSQSIRWWAFPWQHTTQANRLLFFCNIPMPKQNKEWMKGTYLTKDLDFLMVIEDGIHEMDGLTTSRWHTVPVYMTMRRIQEKPIRVLNRKI